MSVYSARVVIVWISYFFAYFSIVRYVLFGFVWAMTFGKHHFWLLPNLTEDCGFFESFVPLYTHSYVGNQDDNTGTSEDKDSNNGTTVDNEEHEDTQGRGVEDEKSKNNVEEEALNTEG